MLLSFGATSDDNADDNDNDAHAQETLVENGFS
jgi:hypothetical protein